MKIESLNGSRFYLLFINDVTKFSWIYFLKRKSEASGGFPEFKTLVENQASQTIKKVRSDNGTEFTATKFELYLSQFGIVHQLPVTYSPQQNGTSERKNRTIMEMARCLLFEMSLPKYLWAEAANTANYLLNIAQTRALPNKTPYEAWFDVKPAINHLRVFGCICYSKVPDAKRGKLDEKSLVAVHLGYSQVSKGYRVLDVKTRKVFVSRDVKFDEAAKWNWKTQRIESSWVRGNADDVLDDYEAVNEDDENIDEVSVRGTRSLQDIYNRCHVAIIEPSSYMEAVVDVNWKQAMDVDMAMIKKNNTWVFVDRLEN